MIRERERERKREREEGYYGEPAGYQIAGDEEYYVYDDGYETPGAPPASGEAPEEEAPAAEEEAWEDSYWPEEEGSPPGPQAWEETPSRSYRPAKARESYACRERRRARGLARKEEMRRAAAAGAGISSSVSLAALAVSARAPLQIALKRMHTSGRISRTARVPKKLKHRARISSGSC